MKKVSKCFADSKINTIFVPAILEKASGSALFDILHDRLTSFDLVKSGKFTNGVNSSLVKLVLYPAEGHGLSYYICDTGFSRTLLGKYVERTCPSLLVAKMCKLKTRRFMLEKTKKALKEEIRKSSNLSCDPIPAPV